MPDSQNSPRPARIRKKIKEALFILRELGLPQEQLNERSALTLLALLDLRPDAVWTDVSAPLRGITEMMDFFATYYKKKYAPNTRETVRRFTIHQFVHAGMVVPNPDNPVRPTNSPKTVYQIEPTLLELIRSFGTDRWIKKLKVYLTSSDTLEKRYARERKMRRIPIQVAKGKSISLSPGGQNVLVKEIIDEFCPRFTPGARVIYVGDTDAKWAYFDEKLLAEVGVNVEEHGKIPDIVVYHEDKNWLVLIEAVTSHGPVDPKRRLELEELFAESEAGLVFVTAFLGRKGLIKYLEQISWETEVWVADAPSHLIHFNGERFLGPYEE